MDSTSTPILDSDMITNEFNPLDYMASSGIRFANHLLDIIFFYALMILMGVLLGLSHVKIPDSQLILQLIGLPLMFLYYFSFESILGKTPGKFIARLESSE